MHIGSRREKKKACVTMKHSFSSNDENSCTSSLQGLAGQVFEMSVENVARTHDDGAV